MRVKDWMTPSPLTVPPDMGVFEARRLMQERRIRHLPVTRDNELVGILTDRDIRLNLPSPANTLSVWEVNYLLARLTVAEVTPGRSLPSGRTATSRPRRGVEHKIGALPVVEDGRFVGIITETDLLRALLHTQESPGTPRVRAT